MKINDISFESIALPEQECNTYCELSDAELKYIKGGLQPQPLPPGIARSIVIGSRSIVIGS